MSLHPHLIRGIPTTRRNAPDDKPTELGESNQFPQNLFDAPTRIAAVPSKESIRSKIEELIKGMILLKVEDESAWATTLEWTDVASLGQSLRHHRQSSGKWFG